MLAQKGLYLFIHYSLSTDTDPTHGPFCAPSVLITFINMVLFKPGTAPKGCSPWMYGGQDGFQKFLVVVAVLCIPWMLFGKPAMLRYNKKKQHQQVKLYFKTKLTDYIVRIQKKLITIVI